MLAALNSRSFTPHSTVSCGGGYRLGARDVALPQGRGHGLVDARRALQQSCDTWFYKVADTMGLDPIAAMGRAFGLGAPTGVGVVAEVPGIMPDSAYHDRVTPGGYTKGMALNSAIGQGDVNVTPLQLAMVVRRDRQRRPPLPAAAGAPAGDPGRAEPGGVPARGGARGGHRPRCTAGWWSDALTAVVNEPGGTAYRCAAPGRAWSPGRPAPRRWSRIGTVRLKKEEMAYWQRDHAWFASFAPAEDPEIAVVVLNEHGGHGGAEAAPTASGDHQEVLRAEARGRERDHRRRPPRSR